MEEDEEDGDDMIFAAGGIHTAAKREIPVKSGCKPHGIYATEDWRNPPLEVPPYKGGINVGFPTRHVPVLVIVN